MKIAFCIAEDINIGAGYVISFLKSKGHEVKLFLDPRQYNRGYARNKLLANLLSIEKYNLKQIKKFNPEICCFSCVTATYQWALRLSLKVKKEVGCKVIFGGVHPTLVPEEVKKHDWIDDVIIGDGIAYFGGEFDPDKIYPDREIFLKELPPEHRKVQLFMTGVGCPFNCSYCGQEQLRKVGQFKFKRRTVAGCINELQELKRNGAKYILFVDDIFIINNDWLEEFITQYRIKVNLPFSCFVHAKFVTEKNVELLKDAGCQTAWMGIQTGLENLRKGILNRTETNEEISRACEIIKKSGIKLMVDHIFGIPFESDLSNDVSYHFYKTLKPDVLNCYQMLYFPKSKIIEHALSSGCLQQEDVNKINRGEGIIYQTNNVGQKQYDMFVKSFCALPLDNIIFELLPLWMIKIIVLLKAGRGFTLVACLQNEVYFTVKALLKKSGIYGILKEDL